MMGFRESPRIDDLAWVRWLGRGGIAVAGLACLGCAHAHLERWEAGQLVCEVESWVLGTGETEQITNACGDYAYGTRDTGISDNGKAALGEIAEGAVRGAVGGMTP